MTEVAKWRGAWRGVAVSLALFLSPLAKAQGQFPFDTGPPPLNPGRDLLVVSLGDSFASGEGNPDEASIGYRPARWLDGADADLCHRSFRNAHRRAFDALAQRFLERNPGGQAFFKSFACGGATIQRGLMNAQFAGLLPPEPRCPSSSTRTSACFTGQIEQLRRWSADRQLFPFGVDVVLLSIGGNDLLLSRAVQDFSGPSSVQGEGADVPSADLIRQVRREVGLLPDRLTEALELITVRVRPRRIVLVEYPDPLRGADGRFCDRFIDPTPMRSPELLAWDPADMTRKVSAEENAWAYSGVLLPLNRTLREVAAKFPNVSIVTGLEGATRGNGYCALPPLRFFHTFTDSYNVQGSPTTHMSSLVAGLHPNSRGRDRIAGAIEAHLLRLLGLHRPRLNVPVLPPGRRWQGR